MNMAEDVSSPSSSKTTEHSFPLKLTPHTTVHLRLTILSTTIMLFLTSSMPASPSTSSALGSFVYALANRFDPSSPLCTSLVSQPRNIEFATRVASILVRRVGKPIYVGCSVDLRGGGAGAGLGMVGEPEVGEELEALRKVVESVMEKLGREETLRP